MQKVISTEKKIINAFDKLGKTIENFLYCGENTQKELFPELFFAREKAEILNPWFERQFVDFSLQNIRNWLNSEKLFDWLSQNKVHFTDVQKNVGIIMAGNIPLVGFHDLLSVLLSGHKAIIKLSSKDMFLLPVLISCLKDIYPDIDRQIIYSSDIGTFVDAIIATGSNNTINQLKYKYQNQKTILRGTRNSIAVLSGNETDKQMNALADDIFLYFGLGCRSVSKIFLPDKKDILEGLKKAVQKFNWICQHKEWSDNLRFQKAKLLTHNYTFINCNSIILIENSKLDSPIATLYFETYNSLDEIKCYLQENEQHIQCVIGDASLNSNWINFGNSQIPDLNDFADGINILQFLSEL